MEQNTFAPGTAVVVEFRLSESGQKDAIKKGLDGGSIQFIPFNLSESPYAEKWLEVASVSSDGSIKVDLNVNVSCYKAEKANSLPWRSEDKSVLEEVFGFADAYLKRYENRSHVVTEFLETYKDKLSYPEEWWEEASPQKDMSFDSFSSKFDHYPSEEELLTMALKKDVATKNSLEAVKREIRIQGRDANSFYKKLLELNPGLLEEFKTAYIAQKEKMEAQEIAWEKEEQERKEALEKEQAEWIQSHGSERLKLAVKHDYPYEKIYVEERVSEDVGEEWFLLGCDDVDEDERFNPSETALKILDEVKTFAEENPWITSSEIIWGILSEEYGSGEGEELVKIEVLDRYNFYLQLEE